MIRRVLFPLRLAGLRLLRRGGRATLVALGIGTGAALLAAVLAGSLVAQDLGLERATARLAPTDRAVRVVWGGIGSGAENRLASVDRTARDALRPLGGAPVRAMLFRQSIARGRLFDLGAVDGLRRFVRVASGRLPATCRPDRCEVVQLGGSGPLPRLQGLNLVRVGRASLESTLPLGQLVTRETYAGVLSSSLRYHTASTPPLLLAEGVTGLASAPVLAPTYRSYAWTAPLEPGRVHPWSIDAFAARVTQARSQLAAVSLAYDLTAPVTELRQADEEGRVAGRRLLLIGGEAAALLLAFAVLAAAGMRRDAEAEWRRLTWHGARRWQLALVSGAEVLTVAVIGVALGWAAGSGVGALVADRAGVPAGGVLRHSIVSARGFGIAAALAVAAAAVVLLSLRVTAARLGALTVTPVDAAAVGAMIAVVVALARGAADQSELAGERGTGAVLLVLPALIAFVAAVVFARTLAPALRLLERRSRGAPVPVRLAALSLARNPGRAEVAVAFLVVSLGLSLFAAAYRGTLERGQRDQAAFVAPTDFLLREDLTQLVPVRRVASADTLRQLGASQALPVIRLSGNVRRLEGSRGLQLLGVPADGLTSLRWRSDYASRPPEELARLLRPKSSVALHGLRLPQRARELSLPAHGRGDELAVRAFVVAEDGHARGLGLGTTGAKLLHARIPADVRGGLLVSLTLELTNTGLHGVPNGGANAAAVAQGTLELGPLRAGQASLPFHDWTGTGGISGAGRRLRYLVTGENVARFRARQPTDERPVPVVASPRLAAAAGPGGILPLEVGSGRIVTRVVATAERLPTIDGDAVLADEATAATALAAEAPGQGVAGEVWLEGPARLEQALRRPPFDALELVSRRTVLADLRSEPLARGTLLTLAGAALVALALALVGLLLGVIADLRDDRGELFDLEAQGAEPKMLRRHLGLRSGLLAGFGLAGGIATGALLAALVVALVTLTAGAGRAEPPLVLGLDWPLLLLAVLAYAVLAAAVVALAARRAFRADVAGRFAEVGT